MAYKISYRSSFERDFKKLNPLIQNFVLDVADKIQNGTLQGTDCKSKPTNKKLINDKNI